MKNLVKKAKIYFLDLDGTFIDKVNGYETISEKNILTAKKVNLYKPVIFSTGRGNTEYTMNIAQQVGSEYVVCLNGALVVDKNNKEVYRKEMPKDVVLNVIEEFKKHNMCIYINGIKNMYHSGNFEGVLVKEWSKENPKFNYNDIDNNGPFSKLLVFGLSIEKTKELHHYLSKKYPELAFYLVSNGYTIEVGPNDANKGIANKFVCELLNIDAKDAMHIGDSANDMPTKYYLGYFVCMGGSQEHVKAIAHCVGPDYSNSGLSTVLEELEELK